MEPSVTPGVGRSDRDAAAAFARPYVVSWNLTYRCNLACEHCYLDAGGRRRSTTPAFADRSELDTEQCFRVVDEIAAFAPECVTILTGGEPLLRRDIVEIVRYGVAQGPLGRGRHERRQDHREPGAASSRRRACAACRSRSTRSTPSATTPSAACAAPGRTRSRGRRSSPASGCRSSSRPRSARTTATSSRRSPPSPTTSSAPRSGTSTSWCRRAAAPSSATSSPREYDQVLGRARARSSAAGPSRMLVNAKCAPHFVRTLLAADDPAPRSPRASRGGAGGCPAGTHYMGIRPNGDVTPCPYLPLFAGNLQRDRACASSGTTPSCSSGSASATDARRPLRRLRAQHDVRRLPRPRLRHDRRRHGRGPALHPPARHARGRRRAACRPDGVEYGQRRDHRPSPGSPRPASACSTSPPSCAAWSPARSRAGARRTASSW